LYAHMNITKKEKKNTMIESDQPSEDILYEHTKPIPRLNYCA
jgi:hypothetical protein